MNKQKLTKVFKISSFSLLIISPIIFIFGFSGLKNLSFNSDWTTSNIITMGGSSALFPLATSLGNNFFYEPSNRYNADVNVSAGGSGKGITYAATMTKDVGNASKNPYSDAHKNYLTEWTNNSIKTMTVAWDAIVIVYKPLNPEDKIIISKSNIETLYNVFAGYNNFNFQTLGLTGNGNFIPYVRTGGAKASGTATSFLDASELIDYKNLSPNTQNALLNGDYGEFSRSTNESNLETWNQVRLDDAIGAITYLSLGFVTSNINEILNSGFRVAWYENVNLKTFYPISNDGSSVLSLDKYAWFSPLNFMFSTTFLKEYVYDFLWWTLTSKEADNVILKQNFIPLDNNNKAKMFLNNQYNPATSTINEFLSSNDIVLEKQRADDVNLVKYKDWFGAYK